MQIFAMQILAALLSYGNGDLHNSLECEQCSLETAFDTNVHIEASISYPKMPETSLLAHHANDVIRNEAHALHDAFVLEMRDPQKELCEDERTLRYSLHLVFLKPNLISFYGSEFQYLGGAHGSVRYITKTFWQNGDTVCELSLDDLFLPGARECIFRHCENYFKINRCGYYSGDDPSWIRFSPEDLDAFILTEKGLLIIFQNYVVSGYEDEPISLLIAYDKLTPIAKSDSHLFDLVL